MERAPGTLTEEKETLLFQLRNITSGLFDNTLIFIERIKNEQAIFNDIAETDDPIFNRYLSTVKTMPDQLIQSSEKFLADLIEQAKEINPIFGIIFAPAKPLAPYNKDAFDSKKKELLSQFTALTTILASNTPEPIKRFSDQHSDQLKNQHIALLESLAANPDLGSLVLTYLEDTYSNNQEEKTRQIKLLQNAIDCAHSIHRKKLIEERLNDNSITIDHLMQFLNKFSTELTKRDNEMISIIDSIIIFSTEIPSAYDALKKKIITLSTLVQNTPMSLKNILTDPVKAICKIFTEFNDEKKTIDNIAKQFGDAINSRKPIKPNALSKYVEFLKYLDTIAGLKDNTNYNPLKQCILNAYNKYHAFIIDRYINNTPEINEEFKDDLERDLNKTNPLFIELFETHTHIQAYKDLLTMEGHKENITCKSVFKDIIEIKKLTPAKNSILEFERIFKEYLFLKISFGDNPNTEQQNAIAEKKLELKRAENNFNKIFQPIRKAIFKLPLIITNLYLSDKDITSTDDITHKLNEKLTKVKTAMLEEDNLEYLELLTKATNRDGWIKWIKNGFKDSIEHKSAAFIRKKLCNLGDGYLANFSKAKKLLKELIDLHDELTKQQIIYGSSSVDNQKKTKLEQIEKQYNKVKKDFDKLFLPIKMNLYLNVNNTGEAKDSIKIPEEDIPSSETAAINTIKELAFSVRCKIDAEMVSDIKTTLTELKKSESSRLDNEENNITPQQADEVSNYVKKSIPIKNPSLKQQNLISRILHIQTIDNLLLICTINPNLAALLKAKLDAEQNVLTIAPTWFAALRRFDLENSKTYKQINKIALEIKIHNQIQKTVPDEKRSLFPFSGFDATKVTDENKPQILTSWWQALKAQKARAKKAITPSTVQNAFTSA